MELIFRAKPYSSSQGQVLFQVSSSPSLGPPGAYESYPVPPHAFPGSSAVVVMEVLIWPCVHVPLLFHLPLLGFGPSGRHVLGLLTYFVVLPVSLHF